MAKIMTKIKIIKKGEYKLDAKTHKFYKKGKYTINSDVKFYDVGDEEGQVDTENAKMLVESGFAKAEVDKK